MFNVYIINLFICLICGVVGIGGRGGHSREIGFTGAGGRDTTRLSMNVSTGGCTQNITQRVHKGMYMCTQEWYNRYMEYTTRELRTKLKEALDSAQEGRTVIIKRGGERFRIVREEKSGVKHYSIDLPADIVHTDGTRTQLTDDSAPHQSMVQGLDENKRPVLRTTKHVLEDINALQAEVDKADPLNQDPDYWDEINNLKAEIQSLWTEYHDKKERGL